MKLMDGFSPSPAGEAIRRAACYLSVLNAEFGGGFGLGGGFGCGIAGCRGGCRLRGGGLRRAAGAEREEHQSGKSKGKRFGEQFLFINIKMRKNSFKLQYYG